MTRDDRPRVVPTPAELADDLAELRRVLVRLPLPTRQDDVLAALVRRGAPSRLLWRAANLSRTRRYHSLAQVCGDIASGSRSPGPPPPGR